MKQPRPLLDTHILKIVLKGKTFNPDIGIKTYPKQTYGISEQSPTHFHSTHGLTAENGYIYEEELERENREIYLPPFSQAKYCSVVGNTIDVVGSFAGEYRKEIGTSPERFHRRRGRLSEFMEKNGWMNRVYPMMGFQRSAQAREACNKDRNKNIISARRPNPYTNPVEKRLSVPKQNFINSSLMIERTKIRQERATLQQEKRDALDIQKLITITSKKSPQKDPYIDAEQLTNRMSKTANQKQWKATMTSIRKKFRKNEPNDKFNLTKSDWSTNNQSKQLQSDPLSGEKQKEKKDQLKQWFNTTCNSKANPWKYRKAKKMATGSDQQIC